MTISKAKYVLTPLILLNPSLIVVLGAAPPKVVITDPDEAAKNADFRAQGEYVGEVDTDEGKKKLAVQVVARRDHTFDVVGYYGGFPGEGWDGEKPHTAEGRTEDGVVVLTAEDSDARGIIRDGEIVVENAEGEVIARLEKVRRRSPTLGKKPPEGAVVLFDGTSAKAFRRNRKDPDPAKDKPRPAGMEKGLLKPPAFSRREFGDCHLHLEFRTPFQPVDGGQGRGNSGVYLQSLFEVQILDSFGETELRSGHCGGIYSVAPPKFNLCYPPLSWQTYDIDYTAPVWDEEGKRILEPATMTVRHNGVLLHDEVVIPKDKKKTTAAPGTPGPGSHALFLQHHGNPVRYRNIWIIEKEREAGGDGKAEKTAERDVK